MLSFIYSVCERDVMRELALSFYSPPWVLGTANLLIHLNGPQTNKRQNIFLSQKIKQCPAFVTVRATPDGQNVAVDYPPLSGSTAGTINLCPIKFGCIAKTQIAVTIL